MVDFRGIKPTLDGEGWELFRHEGEPGKVGGLERIMEHEYDGESLPSLEEIGKLMELDAGKYTIYHDGSKVDTGWYRD